MRQKYRAELILAFATLIWGATFVIIKEGLKSSSPMMLIGIRFTIAFLVLLFLTRGRIFRAGITVWKHGLILGILNYTAYAMQTIGLQHTTAAKSSLITYLFAVFTPVLQYLIIKKPPGKGNIIGLAVVFGGIIMITSPGAEGINIGDILTLGSAAAYAFYIIYIDVFPAEKHAGALVSVQFLVTGLLGFAAAPFVEKAYVVFNTSFILSIAYLSVMGSVVSIYLINRFQYYTTPVRAVIIYSLEPAFSVILGIIFLGESTAPLKLAGGMVIIAGIVISQLWEAAGRKKEITDNYN